MEPKANNYPAPVELPHPQEPGVQTSENHPMISPEANTTSNAPLPVPVTPPAPATTQLPVLINDGSSTGVNDVSTASLVADDADLIEKEWVAKAKNIVLQTKNDPQQQTQKMTRVRADYLKKRYNKELKVSEN